MSVNVSDEADSTFVAVILAGGSGLRFWPLSREISPKQLLSIFGTESLIAQAVHRVLPYVMAGSGGVRIVTGERLIDELRSNLAAQGDARLGQLTYLVEPASRNTAPAIALAAAELVTEDADAVMIVLPSDHLVDSGPAWADAIASARALANDGMLVTIGTRPDRAETGYGHIRGGQPMQEYDRGTAHPLRVAEFIEKPDAERCAAFLADGGYFWNAGIFVMRASAVLEELREASPEGRQIADTAEWVIAHPDEHAECRRRFGELPSLSIDYAIMQTSRRVAVIPGDLHWSDVGSLVALGGLADADANGTVRVGRGVDIDTGDSIVYSTDRLVATLGLSDTIVVDTRDATLVLAKDRVQDVRLIVDALRVAGADEVLLPKVSLRPWGSWTSLLAGPGYHIKLLEIKPGCQPSLQRHRHRSEHWIVVAGTALVTCGSDAIEVHVNEGAYIPVGAVHRIANCGKVLLKVIEVQLGEYVGEDDIERLQDDWNREACS